MGGLNIKYLSKIEYSFGILGVTSDLPGVDNDVGFPGKRKY